MAGILITKEPSKKLAVQIGILLCILVSLLCWYLHVLRNEKLHNLLNIRADEFSSYIKADLRSRIPALQRITQRWEQRKGTPKKEFLHDINAYLNDLPGFQAIEWVDRKFYVRWIVPLKNNQQAIGLNLAFEKNRRIALQSARDKGIVTMTQPIELVQGGKGFLIYFPIFINKKFDGFILAVFNINKWLNYVFNLKGSANYKKNIAATILIDDQNVYQQINWESDSFTKWSAESSINLLERKISVKVKPTNYFFSDNAEHTPEIVLAYGILLSIIISIMFYLLQRTKYATLLANNASQAKSQFLQSMSHELRTPLNAIIGFSELLDVSETDKHRKDNIAHIYNAGNHLLMLINEVLDLASIESGKINLQIKNHY